MGRTPTGLKLKINCRGHCDTERCGVGGERSLGYKQPDKMVEGTGWISQTVFKQLWHEGPRDIYSLHSSVGRPNDTPPTATHAPSSNGTQISSSLKPTIYWQYNVNLRHGGCWKGKTQSFCRKIWKQFLEFGQRAPTCRRKTKWNVLYSVRDTADCCLLVSLAQNGEYFDVPPQLPNTKNACVY